MAGRGPAPKPAHLRQRTNQKAGIATLEAPSSPDVPPMPNPDQRIWHDLTLKAWEHAWSSPMATQWLETDMDALGRLALLWDDFYKKPNGQVMAEIRLQESRFGLSPLDRSRLQWEIKRGEDAERQRNPAPSAAKPGSDLRKLLKMVNG